MSDTKANHVTDSTPIGDLDVSLRLLNILACGNLRTVGDIRRSDWNNVRLLRNMGAQSWREFMALTVTYGLQKPLGRPEQIANEALRDHFAGLAMQGILANPNTPSTVDTVDVARDAYVMADDMLKARKQ